MSEYPPWRQRYRSDRQRQLDEIRRERHVAEAEAFASETGGADRQVKDYFFGLRPDELRDVLREYCRRHGEKARDYAEETFPAWRSGRRRMSGMVAQRLFDLLPPRMPVARKLSVAEQLWHHMGPRSRKTIVVGPGDDAAAVLRHIASHIERVVVKHRISTDFEKRFNWLAGGDVDVKQMLLNHVEQQEKKLVVEGARQQLPVMLKHLRTDRGRTIRRLAQTLTIGNHRLEIRLEAGAEAGVPVIADPYDAGSEAPRDQFNYDIPFEPVTVEDVEWRPTAEEYMLQSGSDAGDAELEWGPQDGLNDYDSSEQAEVERFRIIELPGVETPGAAPTESGSAQSEREKPLSASGSAANVSPSPLDGSDDSGCLWVIVATVVVAAIAIAAT